MKLKHILSIGFIVLNVLMAGSVFAQYFGQNKVQYHEFDWKVIHTDNFDVHYYGAQRQAALDAAKLAEKAYAELSADFGYTVDNAIPLLLYASHGHFQETNITPSLISEGTGGVTEFVKRRVFLPFTGSYAELKHVLKHELVHAFQLERLLSDRRSLMSSQLYMPPLWVIEGMAEYYSIDLEDHNTGMWMRDAAMSGYLIDLETLSRVGDIRVYRFGQSIMSFIGERYGNQKVGELWLRLTRLNSMERAVQKTLGMSLEELSRKWQLYIRRSYLPQIEGRDSPHEAARLLAGGKNETGSYYINPGLSPKGDRLAFISDRDMLIDLWIKNETGEVNRLVKGQRSGTFESLRFLSSTVSWSPDGEKIALSVKTGGKEGIYILDSNSGDIVKKIFPPVDGTQGPSFSPDGTQLVFSGYHSGQSDLYIYDLMTDDLTMLTNDRYADRDPTWSPSGNTIAFSTDRSPVTDFATLAIDEWGIGILNLETNDIEVLPRLDGKNINPVYSPDGNYIAFVSDADSISNIYIWDLESRTVGQLTNIFTGVSGLTNTSPCLSWALNDDHIAFSSFEEGKWNIYGITDPVAEIETWETPEIPVPVFAEIDTVTLADTTTFVISDYDVDFSADYLAGGAAFSTNFGLAGQSYISFSDILGNHSITVGAAIYGSLTDADLLLSYMNLEKRLNWGAALYQYRNDYLLFEASDQDEFRSEIYRGGELDLRWPFSRYSRMDLSLKLLTIDQRTYVQTIYDPNLLYEVDRDNLYFAAPSIAWVTDNTIWGSTGPIAGRRARISGQLARGDLQYFTGIADFRGYHNISRDYVLAGRTVFGYSEGKTPQEFSIGGAHSLRGYGYGSLRGTRTLLTNFEFRFPLIRHLWLGFPLPLDIWNMRGCVFFDAGAAWDNGDIQLFMKDEATSLPKTKDLLASYGIGARLNLGIFVLKYDLARRTDLVSSTSDWDSVWSLGPEF